MSRLILSGSVLTVAALALIPAAAAGAATITVTTTLDELNSDGDCSLREAVGSANENSSVDACRAGQGGGKLDTIKLQPEEYTLTIPSTNEDDNADGDLDYTGGGKLAISGDDASESDIESGVDDRVLEGLGPALTLTRLDISDGEAAEPGGNIRVGSGDLTLKRVGITFGTAEDAVGGGLYHQGDENDRLRVDRSSFFGNDAAGGGGIYAAGGSVTITRSSFVGNNVVADSLARGGGISLASPATITDTTVRANSTEVATTGISEGGGIHTEGGLDLRRSLIDSNHATEGGAPVGASGGGVAALATDGPNRIVNSTIYANTSGDDGGGFAGSAALSHVTLLSNDADVSGDHVHSDGQVTLRNSILPGVEGFVDLCSTSTPGEITSKGFSVSTYDDSDCLFLDSDVLGDVAVVPGGPADNGGRTETIAIESSSVAKDLVPKGKCKVADGEDQRGFERPKGPRCEAGAYERGAQP